MKKLITLCFLSTILSCQKKEVATIRQFVKDEHSFSKPNEAVVKHLDLDIKVDFESQSIAGKATWTIDNTSKGKEIIFDENTLNITKVTLGDEEKETKFSLGTEVEFHGKPLHIQIEPNTTKVNIYYNTTKDAVALQWLKPEQTADKKRDLSYSRKVKAFGREHGFRVKILPEFVSLTTLKSLFRMIC